MLILEILSILIFSIMLYQDFRLRAISWILFPVLAIIVIFIASFELPFKTILSFTSFNIIFITLQLALLTVYFSLKNKKLTLRLDKYIGLGDILLFYVFSLAFSPMNFIIFFTVSLFIILITWLIIILIAKPKITTIPLAGAFSVVMIVLLGIKIFKSEMDFYNDNLLINYLTQIYG